MERSEPGFLLDSGPDHSEQRECGDPAGPGVGHQRRRQLGFVQLQCAVHHIQDPGLSRRDHAIELHLGTRAGHGQPVSGDVGYTALNPYNVRQSIYGPQFFDYKFLYTQTFLWSEPYFHSQKGILGHALGGWRIAPIFTARSGAPLQIGTLNSNDSFGETQNSGRLDGAVLGAKYTGGNTAIYNTNIANSATGAGINSNTANGGNNINMFGNPAATFNEFRPCILGYDTSCGSAARFAACPTGTWI